MRIWQCLAILFVFGILATAQNEHQDVDPEVREPIFICPLPRCGKCPSKQRRTAPGVGFALEIGHGTASIRHENGTFEQVAYLSGSPEYIGLMQNLATSPIERMTHGERPPPAVDEKDTSTIPIWIWFHVKRYLNNLLQRPADPRFSPLAKMARQLQREVEKHLGKRIRAVAISSPDRVRLTRFEISDIFDYLWAEDLVKDKNDPIFSELYSTSAASAGYGQGLCLNYTNSYECYYEEHFAPAPWTLQLEFSNHSLSGAMGGVKTARRNWSDLRFVDTTLGLSQHPREPEDAADYWKRVETKIREFSGTVPPESLLLTGEHASDPRFIEVVKGALSHMEKTPALRSLDEKEITTENGRHFLFATSMGAAEFAKRRQEGMARCTLPPECRDEL